MNISIIGLGGTGGYLAEPLVRYMRSQNIIDSVTFVDGDSYETKNADRQNFASSYVGANKAEYAYLKFSRMFPELEHTFKFIPEYIGIDRLGDVMNDNGAMFVCVDNNYFRKISDEYVRDNLSNFLLVCAGNELMNGQVQTVQNYNGENITKHTVCSRHSEIASASDSEDRSEMSCEQLANLPGGGQVVVANMMAATLMIAHFINYVKHPSKRKFYETFFNCDTCITDSREVK